MHMRLCLAAFLMAGTAAANDTMAELKAGGLVYTQSEFVTMESEALYISPTAVRVDYVFRNASDKDVETYVAFPMPDITGGPDSTINLADPEADNILGFSATQDGKPIKVNLQQRVVATGIDMTEEVLSKGVPLRPFADSTMQALARLPPAVIEDWKTRGLVYDDVYDLGKGTEHHLTPLWSLRSVYWWKTTFPAGRDVHVHHEYTPAVGGIAGISFATDGQPNGEIYDDYVKRYCIDQTFMKTATRLEQAATQQSGPYYTEGWLSYILTTGANWGGTIKKFQLTVDKGKEKNFISFCGEGVKKTGPTTFEMTAEDFYPERDLEFLLLVSPE